MQDQLDTTRGFGPRALAAVERIGNRLPDPAVLFIALLFLVWFLSWGLSYVDWGLIDPRTGSPLIVKNQLSGDALVLFFSSMVTTFAHFHPIGVVLVAMLGIGVAEHTGFINSALRAMLSVTARWLAFETITTKPSARTDSPTVGTRPRRARRKPATVSKSPSGSIRPQASSMCSRSARPLATHSPTCFSASG